MSKINSKREAVAAVRAKHSVKKPVAHHMPEGNNDYPHEVYVVTSSGESFVVVAWTGEVCEAIKFWKKHNP